MAKPYRYRKKVFKIGHSVGVTLPSIWCRANMVLEKEPLTLEVYEDRIVITKQEDDRSSDKNRS